MSTQGESIPRKTEPVTVGGGFSAQGRLIQITPRDPQLMYFYHMWSRRETALVTYLLWKTQETMDRQIGAPRGQIGVQNPGYASVWQRGAHAIPRPLQSENQPHVSGFDQARDLI